MDSKFHVEFGRPQHRWLVLKFRYNSQVVEIAASAIPRDSIGDLAGAIALLMKDGLQATVSWNEEPTENDFVFVMGGEGVRLTVIKYPDSRRSKQSGTEVLSLEGSKFEICLPFWRALRRLEALMLQPEYHAAWGHRFPEAKLEEITALFERAKQCKD